MPACLSAECIIETEWAAHANSNAAAEPTDRKTGRVWPGEAGEPIPSARSPAARKCNFLARTGRAQINGQFVCRKGKAPRVAQTKADEQVELCGWLAGWLASVLFGRLPIDRCNFDLRTERANPQALRALLAQKALARSLFIQLHCVSFRRHQTLV